LIDPPAVFASESQHDEDDDEEMDMSELVQKCQITPNIDKEKWSESSGSFILQGGNFNNRFRFKDFDKKRKAVFKIRYIITFDRNDLAFFGKFPIKMCR
jgi:hypothetical protein